jgi:hypothetical protein
MTSDTRTRAQHPAPWRLESATTTTTLPAGAIGRNRSDVLDTTNLEARTGQGTKRSLRARAGGLGLDAASGPDLDVHGGDTWHRTTVSFHRQRIQRYSLSLKHPEVWWGLHRAP